MSRVRVNRAANGLAEIQSSLPPSCSGGRAHRDLNSQERRLVSTSPASHPFIRSEPPTDQERRQTSRRPTVVDEKCRGCPGALKAAISSDRPGRSLAQSPSRRHGAIS